MADELDAQGQDSQTSDEDFDWASFFAGDEPSPEAPQPSAAPATPAPTASSSSDTDDEEDEVSEEVVSLRKQVEQLSSTVAETAKTTTKMAQQARISAAIEAWKTQASPAELEMADLLVEAQDVDDLKRISTLIKRASSGFDKAIERKTIEIERKVQSEFGLPVSPTFQPIPDQAEYEKAIEEGDLDRAAALALKGVFNT